MIASSLANPLVKGALLGGCAAVAIDLKVWLESPTWKEDGFNWGVASKRWITGIVSGVLGAAGLGLVG